MVALFKSSDGKLFQNRRDYRKHEIEISYTIRKRTEERCIKKPGSIKGQPFNIFNCSSCEIQLLDYCDQVQVKSVQNSKIFIAASSGSVSLRNCSNCIITVACKQLRVCDSFDCTLYVYCQTEPVIELSKNLKFANFNGAYNGLDLAIKKANLDPDCNLWYSVHDFSDTANEQNNWSYLDSTDQDMWFPLGPSKLVFPLVYPDYENKSKNSDTQSLRKRLALFLPEFFQGFEKNPSNEKNNMNLNSEAKQHYPYTIQAKVNNIFFTISNILKECRLLLNMKAFFCCGSNGGSHRYSRFSSFCIPNEGTDNNLKKQNKLLLNMKAFFCRGNLGKSHGYSRFDSFIIPNQGAENILAGFNDEVINSERFSSTVSASSSKNEKKFKNI